MRVSRDDSPDEELHPAAGRCDVVLHQAFRARHVRQTGIGGEDMVLHLAFRARHLKHEM